MDVIDGKGDRLGMMSTDEAYKIARGQGLDLVEIGPTAKPPLVKMLDFGKFMYQKEKKEKHKKSVPAQEIKTVRIGLYTGEHDLMTKAQQADKFLKKGHPVRVEMFLRGREKRMGNEARERTKAFPNYISVSHIVDGEPRPSPRGFMIQLRPTK